MNGGAIRKELTDAANLPTKRGEDETAFLIRLQKAVSEDITEDAWNGLSPEAQDWNNQAADCITKKTPLPPFPDEKEAAPEKAPATRRRGAAAASTPAATAFTPSLGDNVLVTSKRGKVVQGIIVELTADIVVLNANGTEGDEADDIEIALDGAAIVPSNTAEALKIESQAAQATAGAAQEDPARPPEVGDSVKVKTKRGKEIIGKLTAIDGDGFALVDASGNDHDLAHSQVESFELKARGKQAADVKQANPGTAPTRRGTPLTGGGSEPGANEPAVDKPKRSSNEPGVSVGNRIRDMLIEDPSLTDEQIGAKLTKEKIEFRPPTVKMIAKDTRYVLQTMNGGGAKAAAPATKAAAAPAAASRRRGG